MPSVLNLGFRPFYLLASAFACLWIVAWVLQYTGHFPAGAYLQGPVWHGHEMVFGFALAVISGFLLTAVRNWTSRPTPSGFPLLVLCLIWIAARLLVLTPFALAATAANVLFPLAVAVAIGIPLVQSGNRRNYFFIALLAGIGAASLVVHLGFQGVIELPARAGLVSGLDVILFVISVMGGRVIPMFTNNGVPGTQARRHPWVEKTALGGVIVLLFLDLFEVSAPIVGAIALATGIAHAVRLFLWQPWRTLRTPIVWILHAGYAWIVIHLALRALAAAGLVSESLAFHALAVGAIGGLTIGMMTRTARGHTGRLLRADAWESAAYACVQLAAVVRVFGGFLLSGEYVATVITAGALWSVAFGLYFVRYWPILTQPRADGRPG